MGVKERPEDAISHIFNTHGPSAFVDGLHYGTRWSIHYHSSFRLSMWSMLRYTEEGDEYMYLRDYHPGGSFSAGLVISDIGQSSLVPS